MADDDYFGDIPDDVFTAAFDAAEKTRKAKAAPKPAAAKPASIPSPPAPKTTSIAAPPAPKSVSIPSPPAPKLAESSSTTIPGPPGPPKVQQPIPQKVTSVPLPASAAQPVQKKPAVQQPVPQKLNKSAGAASNILVSPRQVPSQSLLHSFSPISTSTSEEKLTKNPTERQPPPNLHQNNPLGIRSPDTCVRLFTRPLNLLSLPLPKVPQTAPFLHLHPSPNPWTFL